MSPTFKTDGTTRYSIFSNEENRMHIHIYQNNKQAKVWLEPIVELAENKGFSTTELNKIIKTVKENEDDFKAKYKAHIG
ncbi:hypothetical protein FACS189434_07030 [Bacteroidia bacterium]|nr:hypothetical protein FACS189434_07030 [Bacteroidia bacterium]